MTPDMEAMLLTKLTEVAQQQAVNTERMAGLLERIGDEVLRASDEREKQHADTRAKVESIGRMVVDSSRADAEHRDAWWRKAIVVLGLSLIVAEVVGAGVMKLLSLIK